MITYIFLPQQTLSSGAQMYCQAQYLHQPIWLNTNPTSFPALQHPIEGSQNAYHRRRNRNRAIIERAKIRTEQRRATAETQERSSIFCGVMDLQREQKD